MPRFEITTREIATGVYLVDADDADAARDALNRGEFVTDRIVDAEIDEILEVELME